MAAEKWVTVSTKYCELIGLDVQLQERRVYPAEMMPDMSGFRVIARKCSADLSCNLAGIPCQWAFTNPECDRFPML
jgi:hypothetical protein